MFRRVIKYSNKHFSLFKDIENITDGRQKPQISTTDISSSIISMLFSNLGSLNKFNQARDISSVGNIAGRIPSASTVARAADSIDIDTLREILNTVYLKARRSKMISPYLGKWVGIIDGHEITSSNIHKCGLCSVRNVSRIEGQVKLNYFHRYTAFILAGPKFCFMLDIEPIYPGEGELSSSYRLLCRVCRDYPRAFEVVVGDGLSLNGTTFNLSASHGKYAAAVLKDERRYLYDEAISLSEISDPVTYEGKEVSYRVWDHTVSGMWDGYKDSVRIIKSEEIKTVRHHSDKLEKWEYIQESRLVMGNQPAFSHQFEKCCINMPRQVAD